MSAAALERWEREKEQGYTMPDEHREKIGEAMKGNKNSLGKKHPPLSEESKQRIRDAAQRREKNKKDKQKAGE